MPFTDVRGYSMHYALDNFTDPWTEPETILLHHGYCRSGRFWYSWVPLLSRQYQVLRPDARGCGDSPSPGPDFQPTLEGFVADALALMDALQLKKVHYVGESFGGVIGLQLAYAHPERVSSLTLCNTPGWMPSEATNANKAGFQNRIEAIDALGVEGWCRKTIRVRLDQERASPELSSWYCREIGKTDPTMAKRWSTLTPGFDFGPRLREIQAPVLLLSPGKSLITSVEQQKAMAATLPQAELVIIDNVGHGINVLEPERCTHALLGFLERVSAGRKGG